MRYYYINVLRVSATFAVVFLHVSASLRSKTTPLTSFDWWICNLADSAVRWSVPIFVMIGGALLVDPRKEESAAAFYRKRLGRIGVPLVFWTVIYFVGVALPSSRELTTEIVFYNILSVSVGHLWYLYMILGLYLFTPFLRTYVKSSSSKDRINLIVLVFVLTGGYSLFNFWYLENTRTIFTLFIPFIGYYLCGYQLKCVDPRRIAVKYLIIIIIFCIVCVALGTYFLVAFWGPEKGLFLCSYLGFPVIVLSIAVFLTVYRICGSGMPSGTARVKLIERIAPTTLGIYLLHPFIMTCTHKLFRPVPSNGISLLIIPIETIVLFLLCYVIIAGVMKVPILKRTVS